MSDRKKSADPQSEVRVLVPSRSPVFTATKRVVQALFGLMVIPRRLAYICSRSILGRRAFLHASESIARIPGIRGCYLRQAFYRHTLDQCGSDVYFGWQSVFSMPEARIGDEVYIGRFCSIGFADIGAGAMLADGVQVLSGGREHGEADGTDPLREQDQVYRQIRIGPHAWLGAGSIIMHDIGEGAIVGAGAVVTGPVAPGSIVAGVPARTIRKRRSPTAVSGQGRP